MRGLALMDSTSTLIVYRGRQVTFPEVHAVTAELLGGHLRPDADIVAHASAPVRVDSSVQSHPDHRIGTVRVLHLAVPEGADPGLTDLSRMLLRKRLGFPEDVADEAWEHFGHVHSEAIGLALSDISGPVAVLSVRDDGGPRGSYSIFAAGRRVWSASYEPASHYTTWDGNQLRVEPMEVGDAAPLEGAHSDFPAHGLKLLFSQPLALTHSEVQGLVASLWRASRPPTEAADGIWLVEEGRFVPPGRKLTEEDWGRFVTSF